MSDRARLDEAHAMRYARVCGSRHEQLDEIIDAGLSEEGLVELEESGIVLSAGTADVTPDDRKKLKGILDRLKTKKHPFAQCMRDLEKHKPEWSDQRRKETCAVLKDINEGTTKWRKGRQKAAT